MCPPFWSLGRSPSLRRHYPARPARPKALPPTGLRRLLPVGMTALIAGPLSFAISQKNLIAGLSASTRLQVFLGEALTFRRGEGGFAVASAWLVLWENGRWRPQPSWTDRLGRLLGLFWVLTISCAWPVARCSKDGPFQGVYHVFMPRPCFCSVATHTPSSGNSGIVRRPRDTTVVNATTSIRGLFWRSHRHDLRKCPHGFGTSYDDDLILRFLMLAESAMGQDCGRQQIDCPR